MDPDNVSLIREISRNSRITALAALTETIIGCRLCPRLVAWREETARVKRRMYREWDYWGRPIPGFGDPDARVLIVGLAPAAHGGNRTGRAFTGDSSGDFLYRALFNAGFANQPTSEHRADGLALTDVYIASACRCVPPDNKPTPQELATCRPYLAQEIALLPNLVGFVTLGKIGTDALLRALNLPVRVEFGHNRLYNLGEGWPWLLTAYHPSRQNTQTGRLTPAMYDELWGGVRRLLDGPAPDHQPPSDTDAELPGG